MKKILFFASFAFFLAFPTTQTYACSTQNLARSEIDRGRGCVQAPCNPSVYGQVTNYYYYDNTICSEYNFYSNASCTGQEVPDPQCLLQRPNCYPGECGGNGICTNTQLISNNQICSNGQQYITPPTCDENDTNCQALAANADWCQEVTCGSQCNTTNYTCNPVYARQNQNVGTPTTNVCGPGTPNLCNPPGITPTTPPTATPTPAPKGCYQNCTSSSECGTASDGVGLICATRPGTTTNVCLRDNNRSDSFCRPPTVATNTPTPTPTSTPLCGSGCSIVDGGGPRTCTPAAGLTNNNYLYINKDPSGYAAGHCGTACLSCPAGTAPSSDHCRCVTPTPATSACAGNSLCGSGGICAGAGAGGNPAFSAGCDPGCGGNWVYTSGGDNQCSSANPYCFTCTSSSPPPGGGSTTCANGGGTCAGAGAGGGPAFSGSAPSCAGYWSYYGLDTCPQGGAVPYCFICIVPQATPTRVPTLVPTSKPYLQTSGGSVHGQQ